MKLITVFKYLLIAGSLSLFSCSTSIEYSPYQAALEKKYLNTTSKNLNLINEIQTGSERFSFAFIADSHFHYKNLRRVIEDINSNNEISFVIFGGDIADQGLLKEFEIFHDILQNLEMPYLTVIGNHDYLSNGEIIYQQMFGGLNFTFEFNNCKFVLFDNVFWESEEQPNFDWLESNLYNETNFDQVFVVAHIPPFGDQFDEISENNYVGLLAENNVQLALHGHTHSFLLEDYYADGVTYLTNPSLKKPVYSIITVEKDSFEVKKVEL